MTTQNLSSDQRQIIHVDMDAFFASVEQRDNPELRGKPIAVGHDGPRGVIATASYEARRFGVHSAMSSVSAKRMCPALIIVEPKHHYYSEVSRQIHAIFQRYTSVIEPVSIDEAFLDITPCDHPVETATEIRGAISSELHLTASAGISYNKFLAKIASDQNKPNGQFAIMPDDALAFLATLPVEKIWGVGPRTKQMMHKMGIFTGGDLRRVSRTHLIEVFGKAGNAYYDFARGIDLRPVATETERKSVGCEETFEEDVTLNSQAIIHIYNLTLELVRRLKKAQFKGKTLTLKAKFADFKTVTRSITADHVLETKDDILPLAKRLLKGVNFSAIRPIRLLGLTVGGDISGNFSRNANRQRWVQGWLDFGEPNDSTTR